MQKPQNRAFLALQSVRPLRPEEVYGLRWRDLDVHNEVLRVRQVVNHPDRNRPIVKPPKTESSIRDNETPP